MSRYWYWMDENGSRRQWTRTSGWWWLFNNGNGGNNIWQENLLSIGGLGGTEEIQAPRMVVSEVAVEHTQSQVGITVVGGGGYSGGGVVVLQIPESTQRSRRPLVELAFNSRFQWHHSTTGRKLLTAVRVIISGGYYCFRSMEEIDRTCQTKY